MTSSVFQGLLLPFLGTGLGSACVFFLKDRFDPKLQRLLSAFAAGVMTAAAIWSLLLPALAQSEELGRLAFLPAALGFWVGVLGLLAVDQILNDLNRRKAAKNHVFFKLSATELLVLAVVLHNIPEGMAVGVAFAGSEDQAAVGALALSIGIALQNIPEGAIISLPLRAKGMGRGRAFGWGVLSGAVEPLAGVLTLLAAGLVSAMMPVLLSFAAGAMVYVVVAELIPEMTEARTGWSVAVFALGFTVMMALDVALG